MVQCIGSSIANVVSRWDGQHNQTRLRSRLFLASTQASDVLGASLIVDGASGYPDMRPFRGEEKWQP
jgi:hypothetical protein